MNPFIRAKHHKEAAERREAENQAKSSSSEGLAPESSSPKIENSSDVAATNSRFDAVGMILRNVERDVAKLAANTTDHDAETLDVLARIERELSRVARIADRVEALVARLGEVAATVSDEQLRSTLARAFNIEVRAIELDAPPVAPIEPSEPAT